MQYLYSDFYGNYFNFVSSKDFGMMKDLIYDEIAYLISFRKPELIKLMNDSGISVQESIDDKELVSKVIDNFGNKKFAYGLSIIIARNNEESLEKFMTKEDKKFSNQAGDAGAMIESLKGGQSTGTGSGVPTDPVSAIAKGVGSIFDFLKAGKDVKGKKIEQKGQLYQKALEMQIEREKSARQRLKSKYTPLWVALGLLAVLGITLAVVIAVKPKTTIVTQ